MVNQTDIIKLLESKKYDDKIILELIDIIGYSKCIDFVESPDKKARQKRKAEKDTQIKYIQIQNKIGNLDKIKENVKNVLEDLDLELNATKGEIVHEDEENADVAPIERGIIKPKEYNTDKILEVAKTKLKIQEDKIDNKNIDEYDKEELKNTIKRDALVKLSEVPNIPELKMLEMLKEFNDMLIKNSKLMPVSQMSKISKITNNVISSGIFKKFKLKKDFEGEPSTKATDIYVEQNRFIKDVLTSFVNDKMLTTNDHQIRLMKVIYENMNPWLEKTGSRLIFYGGNLMRQIHRNINEYFDPESQHIFEEIFGNFVSKSDNDFSLMLGTNPEEFGDMKDKITQERYDLYHNKCYLEVSEILENIRNQINGDLYNHFDFFKYNDKYKQDLYDEIKLILQEKASKIDSRINIRSVKIGLRRDQALLFPDNKTDLINKRITMLFENNVDEKTYIYNSYNNALHFATPKTHHFSLLRSKVNFSIEGDFVSIRTGNKYTNTHQYGGELIDFGIPYLYDDSAFSPFSEKANSYKTSKNDNKWLDRWLNKKVEVREDPTYKFKYMLYGNRYQVELLFFVLFDRTPRPWLAVKYAKRVARSILFEFYWLLDQYPIGLKSLKLIKKKMQTMDSDSLKRIVVETEKAYAICKTEEDFKNYDEWVTTVNKYIEYICKAIDELIKYFSGKKRITKEELFKLNIV